VVEVGAAVADRLPALELPAGVDASEHPETASVVRCSAGRPVEGH